MTVFEDVTQCVTYEAGDTVAATLTLDDVRRAWDTRDPELPRLIAQLAEQPDPVPEKPVREGAPTFDQFLYEIKSPQFRK